MLVEHIQLALAPKLQRALPFRLNARLTNATVVQANLQAEAHVQVTCKPVRRLQYGSVWFTMWFVFVWCGNQPVKTTVNDDDIG